jgi:hypothetical protein
MPPIHFEITDDFSAARRRFVTRFVGLRRRPLIVRHSNRRRVEARWFAPLREKKPS